ncbi:nucleic acid/nucleotide deaminase domain-containing protein [Herbidospora cretacea]|uniref:nucleic acid/nucleotide deaminase domain-containing protein n=1 Tax=Herbidospora cretacea TaxID=28444 RepID=UPI0004C2CBBF|nr:nucleic acid/nucleotide deaminase domain-containing protein [Herbidospora cretacea]
MPPKQKLGKKKSATKKPVGRRPASRFPPPDPAPVPEPMDVTEEDDDHDEADDEGTGGRRPAAKKTGGKTIARRREDEDETAEETAALTTQDVRRGGYTRFSGLVRRGDEPARRLLKQWKVADVTGEAGLRQWFANVRGITPASDASAVLEAVGDIPAKTAAKAWRALAAVVGHPKLDTPEKLLPRLVYDHLQDGDVEVDAQIEAFYRGRKKDLAEYRREYRKMGGMALLGDPGVLGFGAAGPGADNEAIEKRTFARLRELRTPTRELGPLKEMDTREQHRWDRLAWVLANLKSARTCVAVLGMLEGEIRLFANKPDTALAGDFHKLLQAGLAGAGEADTEIRELYQSLKDQGLGLQGAPMTTKHLKTAERRLRKTMAFLAALEKRWGELNVMAHTKKPKGDTEIHVETQVGSLLLEERRKVVREEDEGDSDADLTLLEHYTSDRRDRTARAHLTRRLAQAEIAIGISKLCCFKCWLMMQALQEKGVDLPVTGTHGKVYGWTAPASLTHRSVLAAYLQLTDVKPGSKHAQLLSDLDTPKGRTAVIRAITTFKEEGPQESGYKSSENEDGIELTLYNESEDDERDDEPPPVELTKKKRGRTTKGPAQPTKKQKATKIAARLKVKAARTKAAKTAPPAKKKTDTDKPTAKRTFVRRRKGKTTLSSRWSSSSSSSSTNTSQMWLRSQPSPPSPDFRLP